MSVCCQHMLKRFGWLALAQVPWLHSSSSKELGVGVKALLLYRQYEHKHVAAFLLHDMLANIIARSDNHVIWTFVTSVLQGEVPLVRWQYMVSMFVLLDVSVPRQAFGHKQLMEALASMFPQASDAVLQNLLHTFSRSGQVSIPMLYIYRFTLYNDIYCT